MMQKKKMGARLVGASLCCVAGYFFVFGSYGIRDFIAIRSEIASLCTATDQIKQAIRTTKHATRRWRADDVERERCLREDFYMCGTNELVYRVGDDNIPVQKK